MNKNRTGETIGQLNRRYELEALLNNCVDDDEAILLERELEGEEVKNGR